MGVLWVGVGGGECVCETSAAGITSAISNWLKDIGRWVGLKKEDEKKKNWSIQR